MERVQAMRKLNLIALRCSFCAIEYPAYRIAVWNFDKKFDKKFDQNNNRKITRRISLRAKSPRHISPRQLSPHSSKPSRSPLHVKKLAESSNLLSPVWKSAKQRAQNKSLQLKTEDRVIEKQASQPPKYICLNCLKRQEGKIEDILPETYYQLGTQYVNRIPTPDKADAENCLKLAQVVQNRADELFKSVLSKLEQFKFVLYGKCTEIIKYCENYLEYLSYFEKDMHIDEWLEFEDYRRKHGEKELEKLYYKTQFFMDQSEMLTSLNFKAKQLRLIDQKIAAVNFQMPDLKAMLAADAVMKRRKINVSDVPISAMIHVKGVNYFGIADGRIIYEKQNEMKEHQAHQSLIRTFSFDNQYTLYSGSDDFTIKAWDLHENEIRLIKTFGMLPNNKSYHRNICLIRQGQALVSTRGQFDNFCLRVWEVKDDYRNIATLDGHESFIRGMAVADPNQGTIITVSDDKTIKMWDTKSSKLIKSVSNLYRINNIIVSDQLGLCCITDEENRVIIMDLNGLETVNGWIMPRKIQCCAGRTSYDFKSFNASDKQKSRSKLKDDYIAFAVFMSVSVWNWNGCKIWSCELEPTFIPVLLLNVCDKILVSDGAGTVDEFTVGAQIAANQTN